MILNIFGKKEREEDKD